MDFLTQLQFNLSKGPDYEPDTPDLDTISSPLVRLIAYYLPQFHPIPENDEWWGKGFTEWTNVTKAVPGFAGQYQPHLPIDLGFYDLRLVETLRSQAILAKRYGIYGFCFHHYWFHGQTLLETPLKNLLNNKDIDINFCINWANESWSRRWDSNNKALLIEQKHSDQDDIAFAESLKPLFDDKRYIRVNGRPLLMVYRPELLPDAAATLSRWRLFFEQAGFGNPYVIMPQIAGDNDPRKYGFDAAAGFPPHNGGWELNNIKSTIVKLKPAGSERVLSFDQMVTNVMSNNPKEFTLLPGVCPGWDNTARKPDSGTFFLGNTPKKYGAWLQSACDKMLVRENQQERIVFINAWNEWAEGAHLEPDIHHGYAYLQETRRVVESLNPTSYTEFNYFSDSDIQMNIKKINRRRTIFHRVIRRILFLMADTMISLSRFLRNLGDDIY